MLHVDNFKSSLNVKLKIKLILTRQPHLFRKAVLHLEYADRT